MIIIFSRFHTNNECDGRTDRQTDTGRWLVRRNALRRAVQTIVPRITKFGTHDDLQSPGLGLILGPKVTRKGQGACPFL